MIDDFYVPTNEQIRQEAIDNMPPDRVPVGIRGEYIGAITQQYLRLQFKYFPLFCEDTRRTNVRRNKMLEDYGNKTSTKMIGGKVYEGTSGWSKDKLFRNKWVISDQLKYFMEHINKDFWTDENKHVRDKFMREILKGENPYEVLNGVYLHYGSNVANIITEETLV